MAYDEALAQRIRAALPAIPGLGEKKMFGGIGFGGGGMRGVASVSTQVKEPRESQHHY